jgi:uncharacterized membrane-anchored protein
MDNKKIIFLVFCLAVTAQLYVPSKMIFDRNDVLVSGKPFKFKVAPVDPSDPVRGKYITLNYETTTVPVPVGSEWPYFSPVYLELTQDSNGFASVIAAHHEVPTNESGSYVKAKTLYYNSTDNTISIAYPFDRYYMEESKAQGAEDLYRASVPDSTQVTYALVYVKDGEAVLKDVMINDVPIKNLVK